MTKLSNSGAPVVFTGAFEDGPEYDERLYASLLAEHVAAERHEILISPQDFVDEFVRINWLLDEPAAGPGVIPQYFLSKLASQHVKVVLGGQGGDELFAGYARYLVAYLEYCIKESISGQSSADEHEISLDEIIPNLKSLREYVPLLNRCWSSNLFGSQDDIYFKLVDRSHTSGELFDDQVFGLARETRERFNAIFYSANAKSLLDRMLHFDIKVLLPALLHVEDRTSMAWGIESRVPLLDIRLVESMATVPPAFKFRNGELKHLLRQAVAGIVPQQITNRRDKMGFPVPLEKWFAIPEVRTFVLDILLSQASRERGLLNIANIESSLNSRARFDRGLWGALSLELWCQAYLDQS